jgi:cell division septal protein FtsQ
MATKNKTMSSRSLRSGRITKSRKGNRQKESGLKGIAIPVILSLCILICLAAIGFVSYRSVTASDFFDVHRIDIRGTRRSAKDEISRIVALQTERSGVWNADLPEVKQRIERLAFVRSASVSRVLPNGIRVEVVEREPAAVVQTPTGNMLVDLEGSILAPAGENEEAFPFVLTGWDPARSEKAYRENQERVKTYQKMIEEWRQYDLASRIKSVDLSDLREPRAFTEDSGRMVSIGLARDNFGEHLKRGIAAIVGKGEAFEAVNMVGPNLVLTSRKQQ